MGIQINAQKGGNEEFYTAAVRVFEMVFKSIRYPWLRIKPIRYALGYGRSFAKDAGYIKDLTKKIVMQRKKEFESLKEKPLFEDVSSGKNKRASFLDLLLSLHEEHGLTVEDMVEEVGTIFVAGYDSVSSSIGFVLFLLGHRPEMQEKAYQEIKDLYGDDEREVTMEDLKHFKYLEQCMKESWRMYSTVAFIGRTITEDIKIGDYIIPAGVTAIISPFSVARDPEQWKDAEIFDPEHFSPEQVSQRDPFAFIPFSAGARNCLGQKFATIEEKLGLTYILRRYRVVSMVSEEENRALPEITLKPSLGFPVRLIRRQKAF